MLSRQVPAAVVVDHDGVQPSTIVLHIDEHAGNSLARHRPERLQAALHRDQDQQSVDAAAAPQFFQQAGLHAGLLFRIQTSRRQEHPISTGPQAILDALDDAGTEGGDDIRDDQADHAGAAARQAHCLGVWVIVQCRDSLQHPLARR